MFLQVTQHTESLDSLTQTTGQDQTGLNLLIAGGVMVLTIIVWVLVRQGTKKQPRQRPSQQPTSKSKQSVQTDTNSKAFSTNKLKQEPKPKETQRKEKATTTKIEKAKAENDKIQKPFPEPTKPNPIEPLPEEQSKPKYIGYNPINIFGQTEPFNFPYVIMPKPECIIKFPRKGRTGRKGFKEDDFKSYLTKSFSNAFKIYDDRFITVKENSKPYEPDITFTDEKNGINIFLDIEIDEPYEGINNIALRKATHFQYADTNRNNAFKNRGWIVIRFAEIQVHQEPLQCCLFVADVIKSIHSKFEIPSALLKVHKVTPLKQWTKEQAEQWSKEKYREKYLGIDNFGFISETEKLEELQETDLGELIENEVEDERPFVPPEDKPKTSSNPKRDIVQAAIQNSKFLSFTYNGSRTITKPKNLNGSLFTAFCYVKNREREFSISDLQNPTIKQKPFTVEDTGPNLGLDSIKNIANTAIQYGKFIRMKYIRSAWTEMKVDKETGEVIIESTEAEESVRTINNIQLSIDVLDQDHIDKYNLDENYITAYCNRREAKRTFRFDRISEIAILNL